MVRDEQDKRLDHLHAIIERLANNSFMIKGWAITVASGFLGFSVKDAKPAIAFVGLVPSVIFWVTDAYYLAGERYFRDRYNEVLGNPELGTAPIVGHRLHWADLYRALRTPVVAVLYLTLIFCCILLGMGLFVLPEP